MPFGLKTAPELFQQAVDSIFERQGIVTPYFDDILVASRTLNEHVVHMREVLSVARANNLKLNYDKLKLGLSSVTYLGHQLTQQGITPDPSKVKAIEAIPAPTSKAELLRFLGMATYRICTNITRVFFFKITCSKTHLALYSESSSATRRASLEKGEKAIPVEGNEEREHRAK